MMRIGNALFSAIQFLITVGVLLGGLFFLILPRCPHVQVKLARFFLERGDFFLFMGMVLLGLGIALCLSFYALNRRSYYQIEMKKGTIVYPLLIQKILETYWEKSFPKMDLTTNIIVHKDQVLEIVVRSSLFLEVADLEKIESEVGALLMVQLGYKKDFLLTVVS